MSGWNPPPAPGGPGPYGYGPPPGPPMAYGPPPPRRSSGAGCVIGVIFAGFAAVVLVIVVVVVVVANNKHEIDTPLTAAGRSRDYSAESQMATTIASQRRILQQATGYKISVVKSAVYGRSSDRYVFVGGEGDFDPDILYTSFRRSVDREVSTSRFTTLTLPISDAGGSGKAVCTSIRYRSTTSSSLTYSTAMCAWMTGSTFGMVYPAPESSSSLSSSYVRSYSTTTVASVMRSLRDDVED
ncbi:hypothetical protein [Spirillospora sp. NPDC047279]|uniref:hypothetical protein n=1 Tax=Spirillospora sp. NPDC047279 TaxID=3155478 RepID=UPI00340D1686